MATTSVDAALIEIAETLAILEPELEGLRDYQRLNLHDDTRAVIVVAVADYERRQSLLLKSQRILTDLIADGHPNLDVREVAQAVYADLAENKATIDAALAQFAPNMAADLRLTAAAVEPKSPEEPAP